MTSLFPIAYGFSKLLAGVLGSRTSPTLLLAGGLAATSLCNVAFGLSSSLGLFAVFWMFNGVLQGLGSPACARIITSWCAPTERGTYWAAWNVSHNIGGFSAPLLSGTAAKMYGWRYGE